MIADLPPSDPLGQRLCEIFNHRWLAIAGSTDDLTKPDWKTIGHTKEGHGKFPLRERTLWSMWLDPAQLVGVRFDNVTHYGLIDLDKSSKYLTQEGIQAICEALEVIGIVRTVIVRSSYSTGIHIYFPLPEPVKTFDLAAAIKYALESQEIFLEPGQVEAFPNCKSYGRPWLNEITLYNAHRLPLQRGSGSVLLNSFTLQPEGDNLRSFFLRWEYAERSQDMELLSLALKHGRDQLRKRKRISNLPTETWKADLELTISEGWTGSGQTQQMLKDIACYGRVFERLEGYELMEFIERTAVTRPGYLEHCGHQHDIDRRARAWAKAAEKYYWPMGSAPKRTIPTFNINLERAIEAAERIKKAVVQLASKGQLPECVRDRARKIAQVARTSAQTLYKNLELWHPDRWCVTASTAGDTGNSTPNTDPPPDRVKAASNGPLHTPLKNMIGTRDENHLLKDCNPDSKEREGGSGGEEGFPQVHKN